MLSVLIALPLPALFITTELSAPAAPCPGETPTYPAPPCQRGSTCSFPAPSQRPRSHPDNLVLAKHHTKIWVINVPQLPQQTTSVLSHRLLLVDALQHKALLDASPHQCWQTQMSHMAQHPAAPCASGFTPNTPAGHLCVPAP